MYVLAIAERRKKEDHRRLLVLFCQQFGSASDFFCQLQEAEARRRQEEESIRARELQLRELQIVQLV